MWIYCAYILNFPFFKWLLPQSPLPIWRVLIWKINNCISFFPFAFALFNTYTFVCVFSLSINIISLNSWIIWFIFYLVYQCLLSLSAYFSYIVISKRLVGGNPALILLRNRRNPVLEYVSWHLYIWGGHRGRVGDIRLVVQRPSPPLDHHGPVSFPKIYCITQEWL